MFEHLKTIDDLDPLDAAELAQPWEQYSTEIYGNAAQADGTLWQTISASRCIDAVEAANCADAMGRLPGPMEVVHMRIGWQHSMGHIIPAILRLSGTTIDEMHIASLTYSKQNALDWCALLDEGRIGKLTVVCSHYFAKTSQNIYDPSTALFKARNVTMATPRSHCKILLAKLTDGRTITATGSANTRSAKTTEQVELFGDSKVYQFHREWFEKECAAEKPKGI